MWRDPHTLQIGTDPTTGVLVSGLELPTATWLTNLDGSRSEAEILTDAGAAGLDLAAAVRIMSGLRRAGVLLTGPIGAESLIEAGPLLPELVALTGAEPAPGQGSQTLADRAARHVVIDGANRIGVPLAAILAASGVGRLSFLDAESVRRCDAAVGGLSPDDEGQPRTMAAQRAIRRVSPLAGTRAELAAAAPDLVILCQPWTVHDPLHTDGPVQRSTHLAVAVREGTVVIGPLVVPGQTSCLSCAERHRTDRDPRWPAVAAQLVATPNRAMHEPTSVLGTLAAALAAGQVLDHLDGMKVPEIIDATLELRPPDWQLHRRRWPPHVDCGCLRSAVDPARVG
ncbi:MAG: thiamine biosynthesis protein ThiF [Geodermatophilaceae bacterium]|nr:thiamine biosynthesis protein ThiF [Geodermatophilaceae bacterium]